MQIKDCDDIKDCDYIKDCEVTTIKDYENEKKSSMLTSQNS